ncbi:class I SAM-dependent methyltransferase [Actinoplanes sp. URMC 104]|uniref:class I SAM-dependent methyltransferase n=1 Tax=Actinoplanes sp. URMC 104 TaxID=3423409 RepID=UPI003F1B21DE
MGGLVFDEVPELYDRVRPGYPDELFADLVAVTGLGAGSAALEVGCGTGQATRSLAALGWRVTALEPGAGLAAVARRRLAGRGEVELVPSTFEDWDNRGKRFDVLVAAQSWHWVDPAVAERRVPELLRPGGWTALLSHVVVRRPGEPEMYAATADLHERYSPGNPAWGHPPLEEEARPGDEDRCYPTVQWFDGRGFADLLRTTSIYRKLPEGVREPLLDAIAERIRTRLGDRLARRYLTVLRLRHLSAPPVHSGSGPG